MGRIVLIRGDAGIGKTALLKAFVQQCPPEVAVLWGACDGVSTPEPYGAFDDMADAIGPDFRRLLDGGASRPELGRWLLKWLAGGPVRILVIEDVQWADQATLDLLAFLARRIEGLPAFLLVTHRDGEGDAASVERILGGVASLPVLRQLPLQPLSRLGVERIASGTGLDASELHRITAGNPFYVHEVVDSGLAHLPLSVRDAVRARVARLDERGRRALQVAAILGVRAEPWLLAAVAGEDILGIDECVRVGLLIKADGIAFPHELTRMVVLEDVPVIHGIALHRRALAALEQGGFGDDARLAYHAEGAADGEAVMRHAPAAGRSALAKGAHREAIEQFERALRFAGNLDDGARADLLEPLSRAFHLTSQRVAAYETAAKATALRKKMGKDLATASSSSFLAEVAWCAGRTSEAWRAARQAIALADAVDGDHERALAYAALGRLEMLEGQNREGRSDSERGLALGRQAGDAEATAIAVGTVGSIKLDVGDETGWADLDESARIARESHLPHLVDRALHNLGVAAFDLRRYELARDYFLQMLEHSERSQVDLCSLDSPVAEIDFALGDWDAALTRAQAAIDTPSTSVANRSLALMVVARIGARRGDAHLLRSLEELRALCAGLEVTSPPLERELLAAEAEAAWIDGELASLSSRLRAAYDEACREGRRAAVGELGIWLWRAGELGELDDQAEPAFRLQAAGQPREAAAEWLRFGNAYEAALSLAGSSDPADLDRAHAELTRLGAAAVAHKVAIRLRDLGRPVPRGPRPSTKSNPHGLTEREWEIARLLAVGLSNAEIADQLVVSPKTVGHHVSAVLAKLAVRRRAEVAAAMGAIGAPT